MYSIVGPEAHAGLVTSPMLTQALLDTRSFLKRTGGGPTTTTAQNQQRKGHSSPDDLSRWDYDVRFMLLQSEYFAGAKTGVVDPTKAFTLDLTARTGIVVDVPDETQRTQDLNEMHCLSDFRQDRMAEILTQVAVPIPFFAMLLNLQPSRHPHVYELMDNLFKIGKTAVMLPKHHFKFLRPSAVDPTIQPMILIPGHASYPSGHSTENHLVALVLAKLVQESGWAGNMLTETTRNLLRLADRIGENRIVAGLHYRLDHVAGQCLAEALATPITNGHTNLPKLAWLWDKAVKELRI